ncbi:MAG: hypothetical protein U1F65_11830 [Verrucomicrobiota bacterium]
MRILFDHGTPVPLRPHLTGHEVQTAYEKGWATLRNGDLLSTAEKEFAAFVTTDKNLRYQQNLSGRKIAILVLPTTSWPRLQKNLSQIVKAVDVLNPGDYVELQFNPGS